MTAEASIEVEEPCPDCGLNPNDDTLHADWCRRILPRGDQHEYLQFGPPWQPWPLAYALTRWDADISARRRAESELTALRARIEALAAEHWLNPVNYRPPVAALVRTTQKRLADLMADPETGGA